MDYCYHVGLSAVAQAFLTGAVVGIAYDVFRFLRRIWRFSVVFIALQDILFWLCSAVYVFFACQKSNDGFLRLYFVVLTLAGWAIYYFTAGKLLFLLLDKVFRSGSRIFNTFRQNCARLFERLYTKI